MKSLLLILIGWTLGLLTGQPIDTGGRIGLAIMLALALVLLWLMGRAERRADRKGNP